MATDLSKWDSDQTVYLFTSLTAGSSHIVTATSRVETILRANRIPFTYIDTATNEEAKKLFQRRAAGKKLPLIVKEGFVLGDLEDIEEWNEFGEIQDYIGPAPTVATSIITTPQKPGFVAPSAATAPASVKDTPAASSASSIASSKKEKENEPRVSIEVQQAMARASSEAASIGASKKSAASIISVRSTLSTHTLPDKSDSAAPRSSSDSASIAVPAAAAAATVETTTAEPLAGSTPQKTHRGSSISEAGADEIMAVEAASAIPEEMEDEQRTPAAEAELKVPVFESDAASTSTAVAHDKEDRASIKSTGAATDTTTDAAAEEEKEQQDEKAPIKEHELKPWTSAPEDATPKVSTEGNNNAMEDSASEEVTTKEKGVEKPKKKAKSGSKSAFRASIASFFAACFAGRSKSKKLKAPRRASY